MNAFLLSNQCDMICLLIQRDRPFEFDNQIVVLSADVGPKSSKKLSDIYQKSVRKLSINASIFPAIFLAYF